MEKAFFADNGNAALLNVLVDEIAAVGRRRGLRVVSLAPSTVKRAVAGNGRASKQEVARAVAVQFPKLRVYRSHDRKWKMKHHENMFDAVALAIVCQEWVPRDIGKGQWSGSRPGRDCVVVPLNAISTNRVGLLSG